MSDFSKDEFGIEYLDLDWCLDSLAFVDARSLARLPSHGFVFIRFVFDEFSTCVYRMRGGVFSIHFRQAREREGER